MRRPALTLAGRVANRLAKTGEYAVFRAYMGQPQGPHAAVIDQYCGAWQAGGSISFGTQDTAAVYEPLPRSAAHALVPSNLARVCALLWVKLAMTVASLQSIRVLVGDPWPAAINLAATTALLCAHFHGAAFAGRSAAAAIGAAHVMAVGLSACAFASGIISAARRDPTLAATDPITEHALAAAAALCVVGGVGGLSWYSVVQTHTAVAPRSECENVARLHGSTQSGAQLPLSASRSAPDSSIADEAYAQLQRLRSVQPSESAHRQHAVPLAQDRSVSPPSTADGSSSNNTSSLASSSGWSTASAGSL